jgi:uncharacterized membrane protein
MNNADDELKETYDQASNTFGRLFLLLISGFILAFVGFAILLIAGILSDGGSVSGGAVIFIGPIPIIIGAGVNANWIILFSIVIAILSILMFFIISRKRKFGISSFQL